MFKKLYANAYIRIPLKLTFAIVTAKISYDLFVLSLWGSKFGLARMMEIYHGQNPTNPPTPKPSPYADSYQKLQKIKAFNQYQINLMDSAYRKTHEQSILYNDHPSRQNPDSVDHFIEYGNIYRIQEYINYTFINKLKSQGIQIPEGINQNIRQLEQFKLDIHRPLVPQL